ncbi:MAG: Mov34/MPN/PAD-1 family protein [Novosphingobium sp.]
MGMVVELTSGIEATLLEEAACAHPLECCGLLFGRGQRIASVQPVCNVHPDPAAHFEIDPAALIAAHRAARSGGRQVLGYYHSHPNGLARPSATDQAETSGDGRVWAIVAAGSVTWWRDCAHGFEALPTRVVPG